MNQTPIISVVVTAYNAEQFLSETLDSIRAQTLQEWECIIVDDGSTDGTRALAQRHAAEESRIRIVAKENGGPASARNRGFPEIAPSTKYVTFLDSDDVWRPDALESLANELERFPDAVGAHGLAEYIGKDGSPLESEEEFSAVGRYRIGYGGGNVLSHDISEPTTFRVVAFTNRVFPPGILLARRCYYEKAGPFDGSFGRIDDWDMVVRLSRYGDLRLVNKVIISYRRHDSNISRGNSVDAAVRQMHYKMFFSPENTDAHKRILKQGWRTLQLLHAREKLRMIRQKLAKGRFKEAGRDVLGLYIQLHRYIRGYPTLTGI